MGENIPIVVLSSGLKMPMVALGTAANPLPPPQVLTQTFVMPSKLVTGISTLPPCTTPRNPWPRHSRSPPARPYRISMIWWCRKLGLVYVDLYLVHWPVRVKTGKNGRIEPSMAAEEADRFCKEKGIHLSAWSPWGQMELPGVLML
ncbi:hypothetical protein HHK36_020000 [Tetracentron sinense]|uniref:NADP-dependent oxidoreductase domain-containing protein n=1 Tax=Tetracentron sinense TaxID=13715 RepID=A0A834YYG2_TETSI|nr:hypothetical protein HHK36_020000 [Tetracentron sinense]